MEIVTVESVQDVPINKSTAIDISDIDCDSVQDSVQIMKEELFSKKGVSNAAELDTDAMEEADELDATHHGSLEPTPQPGLDSSTTRPTTDVPPLPAPSDMNTVCDVLNNLEDNVTANGAISNDMKEAFRNSAGNLTATVGHVPNSAGVVTTITYARVAYLGWLEWTDEWVDVMSARVAPINSMSFGQRGDFHVRDEVKHLAKFWEEKWAQSRDTDDAATFPIAESSNIVLVSPIFADVVRTFGECRGFLQSCHLLTAGGYNPHAKLDKERERHLSLNCAIDLLTAIGMAGEVLTRRYLHFLVANFQADFVSIGKQVLTVLMTAPELRSITTETVEKLEESILTLQMVISPDPAVYASSMDSIHMFVLSNCIQCEFLNRRLGGLKMLTDMVNRSEAYAEYPSGLRITRSTGSASSNSQASKSPVDQLASYTVVPACSYSPAMMCRWINESNIITPIFVGKNSHTALMQRSSDIIKFLSKYNCLQKDMIVTLWDVGFTGKVPEALQVLQELISTTMSVHNLTLVSQMLSQIPEDKVTAPMTEILEAIAIRCREVLMRIPPTDDQEGSTVSDELKLLVPPAVQDEALWLHNHCLQTLWTWASDGSKVPDAISVKCIPKIESVFSLGYSLSVVCNAGIRFPWEKQWERGLQTLECALQAIRDKISVSLAIKTIRAALLVWLKDEVDPVRIVRQDGSGAPALPFGYFPLRHHAVEYIQKEYGLLEGVIDVALSLKDSFMEAAKDILEEAKLQQPTTPPAIRTTSSASLSTDIENEAAPLVLSHEMNTVLNELIVNKSRIGFKNQLENCFEFIHFLVRCSTQVRVSFNSVEAVWNNVLSRAVTPQERDLVFNFVSRLILHRSSVIPSAQATGDGVGDTAVVFEESKGGDVSSALTSTVPSPKASSALAGMKELHRSSYCSSDTVERIFRELLCSESFVSGHQFNSSALACVQKFYRWVGAANGTVVELPVSVNIVRLSLQLICCQGKDGTFMLLKSLTSHTDWEIFPKVKYNIFVSFEVVFLHLLSDRYALSG